MKHQSVHHLPLCHHYFSVTLKAIVQQLVNNLSVSRVRRGPDAGPKVSCCTVAPPPLSLVHTSSAAHGAGNAPMLNSAAVSRG
ncbi:hypothetical protein JOB18_005454 [Solea senegalensis]|uniref:Uncharacterized protein n=1 Tax=Solea senegalensis TaxID=28829 RepID=A0AAV6SD83_SOLSE|nr:hypothetical protein JOB18_005454 [Solea senegalensis]